MAILDCSASSVYVQWTVQLLSHYVIKVGTGADVHAAYDVDSGTRRQS